MPVLYVIINCVTVKITGEAQETERTTTDWCRNETTSGPHRPHGTQSDRYQSIIVIKQLYKFNFTVLYVHYQLKVTLVYILMIKKHIWCITTILRTIRQLTLSTPYIRPARPLLYQGVQTYSSLKRSMRMLGPLRDFKICAIFH